jgi:predicted  nucleic acid-binding Zn-ribbon protein
VAGAFSHSLRWADLKAEIDSVVGGEFRVHGQRAGDCLHSMSYAVDGKAGTGESRLPEITFRPTISETIQTIHLNKKGTITMPISNAIQKGQQVYIYNEKGRHVASVPSGYRPEDGLTGYTSATVNVRKGPQIYTYDEKGRHISTTPAR